MKVEVLEEKGYYQAMLGVSLSYNSTITRAIEITHKLAFGESGESKFLESIFIWIDVTAPRYWWQEADTYRISTKQSESTMHTICKRLLTQDDFEFPIPQISLIKLNERIHSYKFVPKGHKNEFFEKEIKNNIPEGFLQRRIWVMSYKTLQNIYFQRRKHRLSKWRFFIDSVLKGIDHPSFIISEGATR